jgi:hypothetical protein
MASQLCRPVPDNIKFGIMASEEHHGLAMAKIQSKHVNLALKRSEPFAKRKGEYTRYAEESYTTPIMSSVSSQS